MGDGEHLEDQDSPEESPDVAPAEAEDCCKGTYLERRWTQHATEKAVAEHLRKFFDFSGAAMFVERYGIEIINDALCDLESTANLTNPAGFLNWAVRQKARRRRRSGAPPPDG